MSEFGYFRNLTDELIQERYEHLKSIKELQARLDECKRQRLDYCKRIDNLREEIKGAKIDVCFHKALSDYMLKENEEACKILKRYNDNVKYYNGELSGSWSEILSDSIEYVDRHQGGE
jgi:uncharacterized coiled-coil DUF342 family protein